MWSLCYPQGRAEKHRWTRQGPALCPIPPATLFEPLVSIKTHKSTKYHFQGPNGNVQLKLHNLMGKGSLETEKYATVAWVKFPETKQNHFCVSQRVWCWRKPSVLTHQPQSHKMLSSQLWAYGQADESVQWCCKFKNWCLKPVDDRYKEIGR